MHRQGRDVFSCKIDLSEIRLYKACDHIKAGGLAGTIGPEQADDLPGVHVKRHVRDNGPVTELFSEMLNAKLRCQFRLLLGSRIDDEVDSIVLGAVTLNFEETFCQIVTEGLTLIRICALA